MTERVLAVVRNYQELIAALRARAAELGAAGETYDDVAGLPVRYTTKLLSPAPIKTLGRTSMGPLLGVLGLKLLVMEDTEALDKIRARLVASKNPSTSIPAQGKRKRRRFLAFRRNPELARALAQRRVLAMSPQQRSALGRKANRVRWGRARRGGRARDTSPTAAQPARIPASPTPAASPGGVRGPARGRSPARRVRGRAS